MGTRTLDGFRDQLNVALGERRQTNEILDEWINDAIQEIFGEHDVEARRKCATASTVADQEAYALPSDCFAILVLRDTTNKRIITRTDPKVFNLRDRSKTGKPKEYMRLDNGIYLNPVPAGVYTLELTYIKNASALSTGSSTTELPPIWDRVVHLLAVRNAMEDLGDKERAELAFIAAGSRIRKVPLEAEEEGIVPQGGVEIAHSREDLESFGGP